MTERATALVELDKAEITDLLDAIHKLEGCDSDLDALEARLEAALESLEDAG